MNKHITIIILAILIAIIPLLGFPIGYIKFFTIILALAIALISFAIYRRDLATVIKNKPEQKSNTFVDNLDQNSGNNSI